MDRAFIKWIIELVDALGVPEGGKNDHGGRRGLYFEDWLETLERQVSLDSVVTRVGCSDRVKTRAARVLPGPR